MDKPREPDVYLNVRVDQIHEDEENPNIRGPNVGSIADLKDSVAIHGIEEPLWVRPRVRDGKRAYWHLFLLDGRRRLACARALDLHEVPVIIKDVDGDQAIELMLAKDMQKKQPPIVIDKEGQVVGGLCWAFHREFNAGKRQIDIAVARGVPSDTVGAFIALYDDSVDMKKAVANGRVAITVYSLMKHQPTGFKAYILTKKSISARVVRKEMKEWPVTEARLKREERAELDAILEDANTPIQTELFEEEPEAEEEPGEEVTAASILHEVERALHGVGEMYLQDTDLFLLRSLVDVIEEIESYYEDDGGLEDGL
jgi:hypothetical protein